MSAVASATHVEPTRSTELFAPKCPNCGASWFDVTMISQCNRGASCSIVNHKPPHAHYACSQCQKPFWLSYGSEDSEHLFGDSDRNRTEACHRAVDAVIARDVAKLSGWRGRDVVFVALFAFVTGVAFGLFLAALALVVH